MVGMSQESFRNITEAQYFCFECDLTEHVLFFCLGGANLQTQNPDQSSVNSEMAFSGSKLPNTTVMPLGTQWLLSGTD